ncbi:MAG: carboxylating nicotinate-nucleotide diphosphorylase [Candidatus Bathyarchaeota archaeon]|nr:carboxylating nicotinate-nucleotide diphosphorylase [Candidatus Bathyarchaeota archaeon]MDH5732314.1 carboxylating nicotinate-nucleotide diphosphorylase [Candidatus Bathyarchaeota archaeon]
MFLPQKILEERIRRFLEEDLGQGDITTLLIPDKTIVEGEIITKEEGIIAGIEEVKILLESQDFQVETLILDGSKVKKETAVLRIIGDARTLLSIERTLLNILTRMSGIATTTHRLIEKVRSAGFKTRVASTRKVAPGLLYFDKKAVMLGGGDTHRLHLDDLVLIKDNHLAIVGDVTKAIKKAQEAVSFSKKIEIEVSTSEEALEAVKSGADIVMLDNFSPNEVEETILLLRKNGLRDKVLIEASGGIDERNILEYAPAVDIISLGKITDSAEALDISLEMKSKR